ncbi:MULTISPECIES: methyl-accepting chemotaxis protein [Pseudomonas]|uniref:methyl-accepting chemotaxis protein n=1 Tax=Pseudomonas TaxID=286 RepID=UPI000CFCFBEF|nr:methyl-accepting chemotaxis protein [Pseudomonas trivialis]PRB28521.1 methyl-accepting chemotaxis protein [Pseudomonas sp. MYb60]
MWLRRFRFATRMRLCFAAVILALVGVGAFAMLQAKEIRSSSLVIETDALPGIALGDDMTLAFTKLRFRAVSLLTSSNPEALQALYDAFNVEALEFVAAQQAYRPLITSEHERALFDRINFFYEKYRALALQVRDDLRQERNAQATALATGDMATIAQDMNKVLGELERLNDDAKEVASQVGQRAYDVSLEITLITIVLAAIGATLIARSLTASIVQPISQALDCANVITQGDLRNVDLDFGGNDEAAQLLRAIVLMRDNLSGTLSSVYRVANQLSSSAEELSALVASSDGDLQMQNSEIEQAATAITEMSHAVEEVARNALGTSDESRISLHLARDGQQELDSTMGAITQLDQSVNDASVRASQLASNTQDISTVLDVIRSVANQTNLLALNAAIEAARAGEAGRGFAVVADEVRSLAHRTSISTMDIERMITYIQNGTQETVIALTDSSSQATETRKQANSANTALIGITKAVSSIDERNTLIAAACEEQALVAKEIDRSIIRIRDLSLHSAVRSNQTRAASEDLAQIAVDLKRRLDGFTYG